MKFHGLSRRVVLPLSQYRFSEDEVSQAPRALYVLRTRHSAFDSLNERMQSLKVYMTETVYLKTSYGAIRKWRRTASPKQIKKIKKKKDEVKNIVFKAID